MSTAAPDASVGVPHTLAEHRARLHGVAADGGRLAYLDEGPPDGTPVLLLHGMPTSSWLYRAVAAHLAASGLRVVAPDMLGFGASDKPGDPEAYALDRQADRVVALMGHLGIPRWTQVVHDLGGPWTWELVDRHPHCLDGLVVTNTTAYLDGFRPPAMVRLVGGPLGPLMAGLMGGRLLGPRLVGSFFRQYTGHSDRLTARIIEGYWRPLHEGATGTFLDFARSFPRMVERFARYPAALRRLDVPAMTIWGKRDPVLHWQKLPAQFARDLRIPPERMHVFEDAGHFLQEDQPEALARLILQFVRSH